MIGLVCDFCGQPPAWLYPCRDFLILEYVDVDTGESRPEISTGEWMACTDCSVTIERSGDAPTALAKRPHRHTALTQAQRRQIYVNFFGNRTGPRIPLDPASAPEYLKMVEETAAGREDLNEWLRIHNTHMLRDGGHRKDA